MSEGPWTYYVRSNVGGVIDWLNDNALGDATYELVTVHVGFEANRLGGCNIDVRPGHHRVTFRRDTDAARFKLRFSNQLSDEPPTR
ncbi:hypothetical protein Q0812_10240 [Brevundimonas sp. 2R-24]|uniref:Uncharacterized protein n=1 Tax=Peiella sedimenti TaxID=3061083 RepID=A0ABT8SPD4_9CAUL|nr:hypothetical protein [Caulobacteraceae bacterium XZ-24]